MQTLPSQISRLPGEIIPERPLRMKGSSCTNYVCKGDPGELKELCQVWFNTPLENGKSKIRIDTYADTVLVSHILHPRAEVVDANGKTIAFFNFQELSYSFVVRATEGDRDLGLFMFVPIKFVTRGEIMAWERQVFGIPAVKAHIEETDNENIVRIDCRAFGIERFGPDEVARVIPMVNTQAAPMLLHAPGQVEAKKKEVLEKLHQKLGDQVPADLVPMLVPFQQNRFVALREFMSTFQTSQAIFQHILYYEMKNLNLSAMSWLGDNFTLDQTKQSGTFELVSKMLRTDAREQVCAYQYTYDFEMVPGGFIWSFP